MEGFQLFVILTISMRLAYSDSDFTYFGNKGPDHWSEHYNQCAGKHQSPIDINDVDVIDQDFSIIDYKEFEKKPLNVTLTNNGHTVLVKLDYEDPVPYISNGPLEGKGKYEFQQLHFHWGEDNTVGSEDRINNVSYPMELHMVFRNARYQSFEEAVRRDDGVAVMALFYKISDVLIMPYDEFTSDLVNIVEPNTVTQGHVKNLYSLMSTNIQKCYTYIGSLTTPPCSEDVIWIDFIEPILISSESLERFRALKTLDGSQMSHNFRPVQPLNNRVVYRTRDKQLRIPQSNPGSDIPFIDAWSDGVVNGSCVSDPNYIGNIGSDPQSHNNDQCVGNHENPINPNMVDISDMEYFPIEYKQFGKMPFNLTLTNDGLSVIIQVTYTNGRPYMFNGPLEGKGNYQFHLMKFHSGTYNNAMDQKHPTNKISNTMELHMLFYNTKYQDFDAAVQVDDGVAVIAVHYETSANAKSNMDYLGFKRNLKDIKEPNSIAESVLIDLYYYMPVETRKFYTYTGSMNTPPCSMDVIWIDLIDRVQITEDIMNHFRELKTFDGSSLFQTLRPIKAINNRTVYRPIVKYDWGPYDNRRNDAPIKYLGNDNNRVRADMSLLQISLSFSLMSSLMFFCLT